MAGCKSFANDRLNTKNHEMLALLQLDLNMNSEQGDTSTFVLNGEWHLLGNQKSCSKQNQNLSISCLLNQISSLRYANMCITNSLSLPSQVLAKAYCSQLKLSNHHQPKL